MGVFNDITALVQNANIPIYVGYPPTGAKVPYAVHRPLILDDAEVALDGNSMGWDFQTSLYACAASVEAAFNLAVELMRLLQGAYVGGTTLTTSMGYSGAMVEGHYEAQVTVQLNQGGI